MTVVKSKTKKVKHKSEPSSSSSSSDENFDLSEVSSKISQEIQKLQEESGVSTEEPTASSAEKSEPVSAVGNLYVHSKKCLNCIHLAPTIGKKVYSDCHFSKGNENCPAAEVKIVVMLPYEVIANRMLKAHLAGDAATLASLSARLNRQDPEEIQKVLKKYRELLTNPQISDND